MVSWETVLGTIIGTVSLIAFGLIYIAVIKRRMR